jgi:glycosyltransferase involved in cell wall biosynthesis
MISIITINLNNLVGLSNTLNSILIQTNQTKEVIVIDGGSTDGSLDFLKQNSENISYWVSELDKGVYHAMNKGLKIAKGDYCLFLNSGDYFIDEFVLERVRNLIEPNSALIYGLIMWEENQKIWNPPADIKDFEMAFYSPIPHQAAFFNTSLIKSLGGYKEDFFVVSDWGLMLEIVKRRLKVQKIDLIISICENQGISAKMENIISSERKKYLFKFSFFTLFKAYLFVVKNYFFKK